MLKKIFIYAMLCVILCGIAGCTEYVTSSLPTDGVYAPTQSTVGSSGLSTTQSTVGSSGFSTTQSTVGSSGFSTTQSTTIESNVSSTLIPSKKTTNSGGNNMDNTCKLIVKGKEMAATNHIRLNYEYHYAELPLTAIIKELGAKVEWQSKTTAKITFDEKDYFLDTTKGSLIEVGNTVNILMVAPGSKHGVFYRAVGNEFIIDSDSAKMLLINMMGAKISIDYDERIVNIS